MPKAPGPPRARSRRPRSKKSPLGSRAPRLPCVGTFEERGCPFPRRRLALVVSLGARGCGSRLVYNTPLPAPPVMARSGDRAPSPPAPGDVPLEMGARAGLAGLVEDLRGLRFRATVPVLRLAGADFDARVTAATAETHLSAPRRLLRTVFGFGPGERTSRAAVARGRYVGLYDFRAHELLVRNDLGAREDGVVAHELVHALQDQHFGLEDPPTTADRRSRRLEPSRNGGRGSPEPRPSGWPAMRLGSTMSDRISRRRRWSMHRRRRTRV